MAIRRAAAHRIHGFDSMVLLEDTRNQPGKHRNIAAYCKQQGIEIVRTKLLVGDYMLCDENGINGKISVDTKTLGVPEIAQNVFQEVLPKGRLDYWRSPMGRDGLPKHKFDPAVLRKAMITMQEKYGVRFRFVDGRSTGKTLIEYLKGERE